MKKWAASIEKFWNDEEGLGTLEIVLITAVLVGVALLFSNSIYDWVKTNLLNAKPAAPTYDPNAKV